MVLKYQPWQDLPSNLLFSAASSLAVINVHLERHLDLQVPTPFDFQQHLLTWVKRHRHDSSESFNHAVMLLGYCTDIRVAAIEQLAQLLKHPEFYIRGNAAVSLANLQVDQLKLIRQIGQRIFDDAGNGDWTASSAAFHALILLKQHAVAALPELLDYINRYPNQPDVSGYPCSNRALAKIFAQIAQPHPKIVAWLLNLIEQQACEYSTPRSSVLAICALSHMPDALTAAERSIIQSFLTSAMLDMDMDDDAIYALLTAVEILFGDQLRWIDQWVGFMNS